MITLCYTSVLYYPDRSPRATSLAVMHFKPDFIAWCDDWKNDFEMAVVSWDRDPGYTVDLVYDFEVYGLSPYDEALWILAWGKSSRKHEAVLEDDGVKDRHELSRPFNQHLFTMEVEL